MEQRRKREYWQPDAQVLALAALLMAVTAAVLAAAAIRLSRPPVPDPAEAEEDLPEYVEQEFLDINPWSRPGTPLEEVRGIVLHYTGNPGTSAMANRNYFNSLADGRLQTYASSHFIVGLEGEAVQCVPLDEIAYASNTRNSDTISIEACHPDETGQFGAATYDRVAELTAWLCRTFHLDPYEDVIRHYDITGKLCPAYYVEHEDQWDRLLDSIAQAMEELEADS